MSFGYPKEIFPYPAVQYIPINYYNLEINPSQVALNPQIYVFSELARANQIASRYNMSLASANELQSNELLLMSIGAQVEDIKYRAYRVIMVTSQTESLIHTFKIKTDYFYKNRLIFILYQATGAQLATQRFNL
ncbi:hypothetical protein [Fuchsiella alkaliacetigena]|uniref:hypothetical protein n=1 Tax=Fuchsiella alkaliacetigena TaxID=957042 RepID=UPI00200B901B|nr:hypothetical protein [Fuchsiella alkaliacetigena]MCK8824980.1 hypothetical protein [Fuchsiella alkaliacetigena]